MAKITHAFAATLPDLGGDGPTATYQTAVTVTSVLAPVRTFVALSNTGTVTQSLSGVVSGTGTPVQAGGLSVAVDACSVAWSGGACAGTVTTLLAAAAVSTNPVVSYGSMAPGAIRYLRFTFSEAAVNLLNLPATVTAVATGATAAGGDRSSG